MNINLSNIKKAVKYLNKNECIGIPTETVYGLAANAYSDKATDKIFKLKKRPRKNPLIVPLRKDSRGTLECRPRVTGTTGSCLTRLPPQKRTEVLPQSTDQGLYDEHKDKTTRSFDQKPGSAHQDFGTFPSAEATNVHP